MELSGINEGDLFRLVVSPTSTTRRAFLRWQSNVPFVNDLILNSGLKNIYWNENPSTYVEGKHVVMDKEIRVPTSGLASFSSPEPWTQETLLSLMEEGFSNVVDIALEYAYPANYIGVIRNYYFENIESNAPVLVFDGAFVEVGSDPWPNS